MYCRWEARSLHPTTNPPDERFYEPTEIPQRLERVIKVVVSIRDSNSGRLGDDQVSYSPMWPLRGLLVSNM